MNQIELMCTSLGAQKFVGRSIQEEEKREKEIKLRDKNVFLKEVPSRKGGKSSNLETGSERTTTFKALVEGKT